MKKVDYNIEFCHIFTSENFSFEQRLSSQITDKIIDQIKQREKTYTTTILFDDYQPSYSYLDIYSFLEKVKDLGIPPTYVVYETRLQTLARKLISTISKSKIEKEEVERGLKSERDTIMLRYAESSSTPLKKEFFVKDKGRMETPPLIASWYLLRLGVFSNPQIIKETQYTDKKPFAGEKIITVIPDKWKEIDEKAKKIIKESDYGDALEKTECIYFSPDQSNYQEIIDRIPEIIE